MACLLRLPGNGGPGVVSLTTWERDHVVRKEPAVAQQLAKLKPRWLVGLHHNWHDFAFHYDDLFDFSLAGEEDLIEASGRPIPLIPYDACNFAPECFGAGNTEKFWDILYVARAVFFKRIPEFLGCMRALYDRGQRLRVLFLCPVPPTAGHKNDGTVLDVRSLYESMFSAAEQDLFTLLSMEFRYPFPLDLETLAFFYRASKVFVHFASDERRCRVASYAWASGLPVVAMDSVASLLPVALRRPPHFHRAASFDEFPERILAALTVWQTGGDDRVRSLFRASETVPAFDRAIGQLCVSRNTPYREGHLAGRSLDIRLGRHHVVPASTNTLGRSLGDFLDRLAGPAEELEPHLRQADPERSLAGLAERSQAGGSEVTTIWTRLRRRLSARSGL